MTTSDNIKFFFKEAVKTITTGAFMVGAVVAAKVSYVFSVSQLPTAAQLGAQCLSTLAESGVVIGASAGIALATDLIFDKLITKFLERKGLQDNTKAQVAGYFIKRAITVAAVVGFAVIMGASPLVPIMTLVILVARDILGKVIDACKKKPVPQENLPPPQDDLNNNPPPQNMPPQIENPNNVQLNAQNPLAIGNEEIEEIKEIQLQVFVDLSGYDTTPLTNAGIDPDVILPSMCSYLSSETVDIEVNNQVIILTKKEQGSCSIF